MKRSELTALIVDDEPLITTILSRLLAKENFSQVDVANDEYSALELILSKKYDFLILDTFDKYDTIPNISDSLNVTSPYGPRILKRARELGQTPKVIAMSGMDDFEKFWEENKPDYFLNKPFKFEKVKEIIRKEFPE